MRLLLLYARTLRHLRTVQLVYRVWYRFVRRRPVVRPAQALRERGGAWKRWTWRTPAMRGPDRFEFLSVERSVATTADWDVPTVPKLWRYNLHYFDELAATEAPGQEEWRRAAVDRWLHEVAPGAGTGWEPYPTSLRLVNWIKWMLAEPDREATPLGCRMRESLGTQSRWVRVHLERHLLGNHLWANAKALVFAGAYLDGAEAEGWLADGLRLFEQECAEQVLADGGHFERSPMYHALLAEDVLDLLNLGAVVPNAIPAEFRDRLGALAPRMLRWLRVMTHPDGRIAFFNDAAFGIAPEYAALVDYAQALGVHVDESPLASVEPLAASGYVRLENARLVVLCDVGLVGPDYQPGHAHADTLAFECSLDGERVVVNAGTSTYERGQTRSRERSTRAHSTVVVDDEDSSEVWGAFRVARRARPHGVQWGSDGHRSWVEGAHDGYRRLPGRVRHSRRWELEERALVITDRLDGAPRRAEAHFHLPPNVRVTLVGVSEGTLRLLASGGAVATFAAAPSFLRQVADVWGPVFGPTHATTTLVAPFAGPRLVSRLTW